MDTAREADLAALVPGWRDFGAGALAGAGFGEQRLRAVSGVGLDSDCLVLAAFPDAADESAAGFLAARLEHDANTDLGDSRAFLRADQKDPGVAEEPGLPHRPLGQPLPGRAG